MTRILYLFNFVGVLALAGLSAMQWQTNRQLNLSVIDLDTTRQKQEQTIAARDRSIKGIGADLEDFRARLTTSDANSKVAQGDLAAKSAAFDRLADERDRLMEGLEKWKSAVSDRDAELKKDNDEVQSLAAQRNDAVKKFNDLAESYNKVVTDLNAVRAKH